MASCRAQVDASPHDAHGWLEARCREWMDRRQQRMATHRADRSQANQDAYKQAINQETRYRELAMIVGIGIDDLTREWVTDRVANWRTYGYPALPDTADLYKERYNNLTLDEVLGRVDDMTPHTRQGLESALRTACPYDPLDDKPCTVCGRDEQTLA